MDMIFYIATFILGTIIGSFLNVVIFRYNTGKTVGGRSMCLSCSKTLKWNHLVPVFSYLFLMGKCAYCKAKISIQYPIVEVLTGLAFLLILHRVYLFPIALIYFIIFSILLVIAVYDYRHKIIPDGLVFAFIGLSFLRIVAEYLLGTGTFQQDFVSGLLISLFFAVLWWVSDGRWMGFGDAKLALGIGWLLPFCQNLSAIMLSFFVGSIVGLILMFVAKISANRRGVGFNFDREIPFAPFLIFSAFASFVFNFDVLGLIMGGVIVCLG
jgi:leader peptidase (prepilin peptidase)/N-methyltransferase